MKISSFLTVAALATMLLGDPLRAAAPVTTFELIAEAGAQAPGLPGVNVRGAWGPATQPVG